MAITTATLQGVIRAGLEHHAIAPLVREADRLANHLAGTPGPAAIRSVNAVVAALGPELARHLDVEEAEVYPVVFGDCLRSAVDLLVLDHAAIRSAMRKVDRALDTARANGFEECEPLRRALIELVTLVRQHDAKESFLFVRSVTDGEGAIDPAAD